MTEQGPPVLSVPEDESNPTPEGPLENEKDAPQAAPRQEQQIRVKPHYPQAPLTTYYANILAIIATNEELYLDACQVQPQTVNESGEATAEVVARFIISRAHAEKLLKKLQESLGKVSEREGR